MDGHAPHIQAVFLRKPGIDFGSSIQRDTELVLPLAGRDFFMGAGIDIGIDAKGAGCAAAMPFSDCSQFVSLFLALDIELADACFQSMQEFRMGFSDT